MPNFEKCIFLSFKEGFILPQGKKGVKEIILYSPKEDKFKEIYLSKSRLLFEIIETLNGEINNYECVVIVNNRYRKAFGDWYKAYFGLTLPKKIWERSFIYVPNSFEPPLNEYGSIRQTAINLINKKNEIKKDLSIKKIKYKGLFLPEIKAELIDIVKNYTEEELPLRLSIENIFNEKSLKFWEEFKKVSEEAEKIADASVIVIEKNEDKSIETDLITINAINTLRIVAKFFFVKYLELSKTFPQFFDKYSLYKPLMVYIPNKAKDKKRIASFLTSFLKRTNFDYSFENCEIVNPQYKFLLNFLNDVPQKPDWNYFEIPDIIENEYKTENLAIELMLSLSASNKTYKNLVKMDFLSGEIDDKKRKLLSEVKFLFQDLKEVLNSTNPYFESFCQVFISLFPTNEEHFGRLSKVEFEELECKFFENVKNFNPHSPSIVNDVFQLIPQEINIFEKIKASLPVKSSLVGIYQKMLSII